MVSVSPAAQNGENRIMLRGGSPCHKGRGVILYYQTGKPVGRTKDTQSAGHAGTCKRNDVKNSQSVPELLCFRGRAFAFPRVSDILPALPDYKADGVSGNALAPAGEAEALLGRCLDIHALLRHSEYGGDVFSHLRYLREQFRLLCNDGRVDIADGISVFAEQLCRFPGEDHA